MRKSRAQTRTLALLATVACLTLALPASVAAASTGEEDVSLDLIVDGKHFEAADLGDMAIGEIRSVWSEGGEEMVITRTEQGMQIEVGGKTVEVALDPMVVAVDEAMVWTDDEGYAYEIGDGEGGHHVVFKTVDVDTEVEAGEEGEAKRQIRVVLRTDCGEEGEEDCSSHHLWVDEDGEVKTLSGSGEGHEMIFIERVNEDEEGSAEGEGAKRVHKVVIVRSSKGDDEGGDEGGEE